MNVAPRLLALLSRQAGLDDTVSESLVMQEPCVPHAPLSPTPQIAKAPLFSRRELLELLSGSDDDWLFSRALLAKELEFDNEVYLRAIVEFSNYCRQNCHYCGLRAGNRELARYRLTPEQILSAIDVAAAEDIGSVVLQSGDDSHYRKNTIATLIRDIKARHPKLAITLSLGEREAQELALWREAGADRYLLKMETFNRQLFAQNRPGADYDARLQQLAELKALGYQVGSGIITDLPGMTLDILASDIEAITALTLDMIACGPFIAHPQTPHWDKGDGHVLTSHRVSALLRLMNPGANIPATSSLDVLEPGSRLLALSRGCNVVMPSFTPTDVNASYNIYPGKNSASGDAISRLKDLRHTLSQHGLHGSSARGDSKRNNYVSRY